MKVNSEGAGREHMLVEVTDNLPGGHRQQLFSSCQPISSQSFPFAYAFSCFIVYTSRVLDCSLKIWFFFSLIYRQRKSNIPPFLVWQQAILALLDLAAGSNLRGAPGWPAHTCAIEASGAAQQRGHTYNVRTQLSSECDSVRVCKVRCTEEEREGLLEGRRHTCQFL